jgi:hypothetical protein
MSTTTTTPTTTASQKITISKVLVGIDGSDLVTNSLVFFFVTADDDNGGVKIRFVIDSIIKIARPAINLLSIVGLCFSGSFSVVQTLPGVQAAAPAVLPVAGSPAQSEELNIKMAQLSSSNNPEDVAILAYIWGFPLVTMERQFHFVTSPNGF